MHRISSVVETWPTFLLRVTIPVWSRRGSLHGLVCYFQRKSHVFNIITVSLARVSRFWKCKNSNLFVFVVVVLKSTKALRAPFQVYISDFKCTHSFSASERERFINVQCSHFRQKTISSMFVSNCLWLLLLITDRLFVEVLVGVVLFGMLVVVSRCLSAVLPWFPVLYGHNTVRSAVLSQSPAEIKETSHWKESRACCVNPFCVVSPEVFFKRREASCPQTKSAALVLPPSPPTSQG